MKKIIVDISLAAERYEAVYAGTANAVHAVSRDGRSVKFPAGILRRFVTREGIHGSFLLEFDDNNKFHAISRLG